MPKHVNMFLFHLTLQLVIFSVQYPPKTSLGHVGALQKYYTLGGY